jgi:hypothetical protein
MRLRRNKSTVSTSRRQRRAADPSRSSSSFAYRSRRSEQEINTGRELSREAAAPRHFGHFLLRRFGLVILLVALLISTLNVLSLSSNDRVMSLTDSSGNSFLHDKSVYEAAASKLLAGSIWNRNKITVNTAGVSQGMLKQFPELSSVSVTLPLLSKRPIVYVQTAQPALILTAQNGSFVIDTTGKALLLANRLPTGSNLKLPLVTDQSGLRVTVNRQALTSGNVTFIQTVIAQLATRHFTVSSMELPVGTSELDVHLAEQPYTVKFNLESGTARQQAGTFLATQAKLQSQSVTPAQYVDVRVDGRAYYK